MNIRRLKEIRNLYATGRSNRDTFLEMFDIIVENFEKINLKYEINNLNDAVINFTNSMNCNENKKHVEIPEGYIPLKEFVLMNPLCQFVKYSLSALRQMIETKGYFFENSIFINTEGKGRGGKKYFVYPNRFEEKLKKIKPKNLLQRETLKQYLKSIGE